MFKTIVVGVDGREGGRDALSLAERLARMSGADLVALRVLPFDYYPTRSASPSFAEVADADANKELAEEIARAGVQARVRLQGDSSPARALHRGDEEEHAGSPNRADLRARGSGTCDAPREHRAARRVSPRIANPGGFEIPRPGVGLYRQFPRAFADDDRPARP